MRRRWSPHERRPLAKYHVCMPSYEFYVSKLTMPVHCTRKKSSDSNLNGRFSFGHGCVAPLRARRMHQKHVKLVQAFTSSELVEARNWAATSNTTIHSLNDQLLAAKTKANEVGELEEAVRARDNRISELTRMLQDTQTELDSIKTGIDHDTCDSFRMRMSNLNLSSRP